MTSPLGWLLICCLYKEVYLQSFKGVSFWLHGCCGSGKVGTVNQVNHTSWVVIVTPTDRRKSVRNRCVIELSCGVVCIVTLPFLHFCWCRGFCHRTDSDLFLFLFAWLSVKMTFVFHLLVTCVQWSHVSEHRCRFCQLSIFLVLHIKSSPALVQICSIIHLFGTPLKEFHRL